MLTVILGTVRSYLGRIAMGVNVMSGTKSFEC